MIKKIRRKRIVVKQKEVFVVRIESEPAQICPVCRRILNAPSAETKQISAGNDSGEQEKENERLKQF